MIMRIFSFRSVCHRIKRVVLAIFVCDCIWHTTAHGTHRRYRPKFRSSSFRCWYCGRQFRAQKDYHYHITNAETHCPRTTGYGYERGISRTNCSLCGVQTASGVDLLNHVNEVHYQPLSKKPTLICPHCLSTFKSCELFVSHLMAENNCLRQNNLCMYCMRVFHNRSSLELHLETDHSNTISTPYKCAYCPTVKINIESLHQHFKMRHCPHAEPWPSKMSL